MHPLYQKADKLSAEVIGAAIEVHRQKGPGLIESIYERCLLRELELRSIPATTQKIVRVEYKRLIFDGAAAIRSSRGQLFAYRVKGCRSRASVKQGAAFSKMKLLDIPIGLLINFHEPVLKNGILRMILPGANQVSEDAEVSL
jgi:hypothetical protein